MTTQNEYSQYKVIFKSTPDAIDFGELSLRSFPSISLRSDIFKFYPYGELYFNDMGGLIIDGIGFAEGLKFEFKIGNDDIGFIGHDFFWSESQVNNTKMSNFISGDNIFILKSYYNRIDRIKSRAWSSKKLSDVVKEIATKDYEITDTSFIKDTTGTDSWYQVNVTNRDFIFTHRKSAYSANHPKSPFLSFINTNGELYFSTIESLFSEQQPVGTYKLEFSDSSILKRDTIKGYDIAFIGEPVNKVNYNKKLYTINKSGVYSSTDNKIEEFLVKHGEGKSLITKDLRDNPTDISFLGIKETIQDEYRLNGKRNFEYIDSALPIRLDISIFFNPKCVTGKLIDLTIESSLPNKQVLTELSGNWLIISDIHFIDFDGNATTQLTLAKSKIQVDSTNPFVKDFA